MLKIIIQILTLLPARRRIFFGAKIIGFYVYIEFLRYVMLLYLLLLQAERSPSYPRVHVDFALTSPDPFISSTPVMSWKDITAEEEIRYAVIQIMKISSLFL